MLTNNEDNDYNGFLFNHSFLNKRKYALENS